MSFSSMNSCFMKMKDVSEVVFTVERLNVNVFVNHPNDNHNHL